MYQNKLIKIFESLLNYCKAIILNIHLKIKISYFLDFESRRIAIEKDKDFFYSTYSKEKEDTEQFPVTRTFAAFEMEEKLMDLPSIISKYMLYNKHEYFCIDGIYTLKYDTIQCEKSLKALISLMTDIFRLWRTNPIICLRCLNNKFYKSLSNTNFCFSLNIFFRRKDNVTVQFRLLLNIKINFIKTELEQISDFILHPILLYRELETYDAKEEKFIGKPLINDFVKINFLQDPDSGFIKERDVNINILLDHFIRAAINQAQPYIETKRFVTIKNEKEVSDSINWDNFKFNVNQHVILDELLIDYTSNEKLIVKKIKDY